MPTPKAEQKYYFLFQIASKIVMSVWSVLSNETERNSSRGLLRKTKFTNKKRDERVKPSSLLLLLAIFRLVIKADNNYRAGSHFLIIKA